MSKFLLPLIALVTAASWANAEEITSGDWTYTLNEANEATITWYSGAGGEVEIPVTIDGVPVKTIGGGWPVWIGNQDMVISVIIPDSLTSIGDYAFAESLSLRSVTIGSGVMNIGDGAFNECRALESMALPNNLSNIGSYAFSNCSSLTSVAIPDSVTSIGKSAFSECTRLTSVTIGNGVISIGNSAFADCTGLTDLILPDGVTAIGLLAFAGCTSLVSVTIPGTVKEIGNGAFQECSSLRDVNLGSGLEFIGRTMFQYCPSLETIVMPASVTNIQAFAFRDCAMLTNVVLPSGLLRLAEQAFSGTALRDVSVPDSVLSIGADCFIDAPVTNASIPGRFIAQFGSIGLPPEVSKDLLLDALTNEFGIATTNDLITATNDAIAQVQAAPNDYDLFSETQYNANRIAGVAQGKVEVTSNPTAYGLFTEFSIMDMNMGGLMLKKGVDANELDLELTIETKDSLLDSDWQVAERITRNVGMDGAQRQFLRVRADAPYVVPNVKVLAHRTLGNILTDGAGRVLYFFAADSPGGNPLFSGSSWPYVTVPEAPKADVGIAATIASSTFGRPGGPYLTVNGRPVYTFVGDTEAGQANGHGVGSVWWTVRADGVINQ